jgi:hypothetical protein
MLLHLLYLPIKFPKHVTLKLYQEVVFPITYKIVHIYRVSQEEWTKLRESVPYVKIYRYNPKHLYPKLNDYGDNGQRKVWSSLGFHALYLSAESLINFRP